MTITVHQAIFGEKNRGHSVIISTLDDTALIRDLQDYHTDRPPNYPSVGWQHILRGFVLHNYYIMLKIVPDQEASRPGMVLTHALIVDLNDIVSYPYFLELYNNLPVKPKREQSLTPIIVSDDNTFLEANPPRGYSKLVSIIVNERDIKYPIVWLGEDGFFDAIHHLWKNIAWSQARKQITFSTSYSPRDVPSNVLVVTTPASQIDAWQGHLIVREHEYIVATTPIEHILLGDSAGTSVREIQEKLECEDLDLRNIRLLQLCDRYWSAIDSDAEIDRLIQLARIVSKLSPEFNKGTDTKRKIISQLCTATLSANVDQVLALRNLDTQAFNTECLYKSIIDWVRVRFAQERDQKSSEFVRLVVGQSPQNAGFWSNAVADGIKDILSPKWNSDTGIMIWSVWQEDISLVKALENLIGNDASVERVLRETCPKNLTSDLGNAVAEFVSRMGWFMAHAVVISRFLSPEEALKRHVALDIEENHTGGLRELLQQFRNLYSDSTAIEVFANYSNYRTDNILGELCANQPELILHFDPSTSLGGRIWVATLRNASHLLELVFMPDNLVFNLFDAWLESDHVDVKLLKYFANSPYGNLLHYPRRTEMWERLDNDIKRMFLEKTAERWLELLWQNNLEDFALESPLQKAILDSQKFLTHKLASTDIRVCRFALDFFRKFSGDVGEKKFVEWFLKKQLYSNIPVEAAQDIGDYILQRNWSDAATEIARHVEKHSNSKWRYALERCHPLVKSKGLLESLARIFTWENQHFTPLQMSTSSPKIRVLFLLSDPVNENRIKLSREMKSIEEKLRLRGLIDRFEMKVEWAATSSDLQGAILSFRPHIVHFSGHGSQSGELIFEDGNGKAKPISAEALAELFHILQGSIRCVVLNACFSEKQASGIIESINCVIGMSNKIHDDPAAIFASHFYQALAHEDNIKKAFDLGRNAINLEALPGSQIPSLLIRKDVTDLTIFD